MGLRMKIILCLFVLFAVSSALTLQTCEQKNVMLKNALVRLSKEHRAKVEVGCEECWDDILIAVGDCLMIGVDGWKPCVEDVLGAANPCIDCVCQVVGDVCNIFGCDLSC